MQTSELADKHLLRSLEGIRGLAPMSTAPPAVLQSKVQHQHRWVFLFQTLNFQSRGDLT